MFKAKHDLNLPFIFEIFYPHTHPYNFRTDYDFNLPQVRTALYGSETIQFRGPKLGCSLPQSIRPLTNLTEFKFKIKAWKGNEC